MPPNFTTTTRSGIHVPTSANDGSDLTTGLLVMANEIDNANLVRSFGKSIISTTETRTNAAYGLLATPDRVQSVVLPAGGLIAVAFQATWQESVAGAASAAIFVGANQLKVAGTPLGPVVQAAVIGGELAGGDEALGSFGGGLCSTWFDSGASAYGGDVTTGQVVGLAAGGTGIATSYNGTRVQTPATGGNFAGPCYISAAAGTYDISVQFKASSGIVTVKNRKLWVWTLGF